ncbi:hypothetical protein EST38_g7350 [Candolleomyces aberdarensis]|uniref:Uncharacterized protein n=1 Tax=Candolleomyces aberdarensis TaxID=2316362 RepID=A0A4Q2DH82_9AGAR|nr:hypothetical protein EST38_g7350 [Candolleomyces aberdarensis]
MGEWEPGHLHWRFNGEHILVPYIVLKGFPSFLLAALLIIVICVTERFYMLIAMTFSLPLILIIATTLAFTQFILELRSKPKSGPHSAHDYAAVDLRHHSGDHDHDLNNSFLSIGNSNGGGTSASSTFVALESVSATPKATITRPRSKSKPDDIFIHPAESNIARADVLAIQLGISKGDTTPERVLQQQRKQPPADWEVGKGRDLARELLSTRAQPPHHAPAKSAIHPHQRTGSFRIGSSSESEDTDSDSEDGHRPSEMQKLVR